MRYCNKYSLYLSPLLSLSFSRCLSWKLLSFVYQKKYPLKEFNSPVIHSIYIEFMWCGAFKNISSGSIVRRKLKHLLKLFLCRHNVLAWIMITHWVQLTFYAVITLLVKWHKFICFFFSILSKKNSFICLKISGDKNTLR